MQQLLKVVLLLVFLAALEGIAFAETIDCKFKSQPVAGITSLTLSEEVLLINGSLEVPLEKTSIKCGALGKRDRFEGFENGIQVILKDCTHDDKIEGTIIDFANQQSADVECR